MTDDERRERCCEACRQYYHSLTKLAFSYLRNMFDAQDTVQDVFMSYLSSAPDFESPSHEKAWLIRVTVNKCRNCLRRSRRSSNAEIVHFSPPEQENCEILSAVMSLPEKYRVPVHLFYYEDMSIAEIAKALGENSSTVGVRLARARKMLKNML